MPIVVYRESIEQLPEYAQIPIAFRVESRYRIEPIEGGLGGFTFVEEPVRPYIKDYDAIPGEGPIHWREHWDISNWGFQAAYSGQQRIGGAAIAWKTDGLNLLEGRDDQAVLWDLRVHPDYRRQGVGHLLFECAYTWASEHGCSRLIVETQNINVPACRFYAQQGMELGVIHRHAYVDLPEEVQLLWYIEVESPVDISDW